MSAPPLAQPAEQSVTKGRSPKLPAKILPTNRISVAKQIEILRAYAASHESLNRPVTNADVGDIVDMTGNTVSLANAFFVASGLLERTDAGYVPSTEVKNLLHAHSWKPDTAAHKLAPCLRRAWFSQALMPKLRFRPVDEIEAITDLAEAARAGPDYRVNLRMILEYLDAVGIVSRDNGKLQLQAVKESDVDGEINTTKPEQLNSAQLNGSVHKPDSSPSFVKGNAGAVEFSISVNISMQELNGWSSDRIAALFRGMAMVLAAKNSKEMSELETQVE